MNVGLFKRHEISHEKHLEIVFDEMMSKAIEKLRQVLAAQVVQPSRCARSSSNQELVDQRSSRKFLRS